MTNNDVLRRLRYTFDYSDSEMILLFEKGDCPATREEVSDWLKKDEDPAFKECADVKLASFLNGMIAQYRGERDGPAPIAETTLNNNIVFRKLKIALDLKAEDVMDLLSSAGMDISKHELSAFFRKPGHKHWRACQDQILRNFLQGLQLAHRRAQSES